MKKLLIGIYIANTFALSLGDNINDKSKTESLSNNSITLTKQLSDHDEYQITKQSGITIVMVNKQGIVYSFKWSDKSPNLKEMIGNTYEEEFINAMKNRLNKHNHRRLDIDTPNFSVHQFGLPGGKFIGVINAKNI